MRRVWLRPLGVAAGLGLLAFYLGVALVGYRLLLVLWAGRPDLPTALVLLAAVTLAGGYLSYRFGTARLLAGLDAVAVPRSRAPGLYRRLDRLAGRMDVGRPTLALAAIGEPNALSVGGPGGVVVLDRSLLRLLDADEVEAILAHELAHLEGRDGLVQVLAYSALRSAAGLLVLALAPVVAVVLGVVRALSLVAGSPAAGPGSPVARLRRRIEAFVLLLFVGLTLVVRAHSRSREFAADDRAVEVTGDPVALARALRKIERATWPGWGLLSPLYVRGEEAGPLGRLLSTHPPTDERVRRLLARATAPGTGRRIRVD